MIVQLALAAVLAVLAPTTKPAVKPTTSPAFPGVVAYQNLAYGPETKRANLLDVYLPEKKPAGKLPVIVWIHGGGWVGGGKDGNPGVMFVTKGYAAVSINYRYSFEAPFPAQIYDCKAAIRWVRAHADEYGFDRDRIGVWGGSAGGHLVALLGTSGGDRALEGNVGDCLDQSSKVNCVIDLFGPADLTTIIDELKKYAPASPLLKDNPTLIDRLVGGANRKDMEWMASPTSYVNASNPPFLILHGAIDNLVPVQQSETLLARLKAAGVEAELVTFPKAGHGGPEFLAPESIARCLAFFDKHLKK